MNDKRLKLSEEYKLRSSQAITPFGMGAIVDFKKQSLMAASTEFWDISKCQEIHDERLEKVLDVDTFYLPFNIDKDKDFGFPFVNFPEWYFCPVCRSFKPFKDWEKEFLTHKYNKDKVAMLEPKCSYHNTFLVPARIVCICNNGHIQDFPWIAWTHYKSKTGDKSICDNPKLRISTFGSSTGLEGIRIECTHCNASASMQGSFSKGAFEEIIYKLEKDNKFNLANEFKCKGNKPWALKNENCNNDRELVVVQRGGSNIHYTKIISSIVIPPYSNKISFKIENHESYKQIIRDLGDLDEDESYEEYLSEKRTKKVIKRISEDIRFDYDEVEKIVERKLLKLDADSYDELKYKIEEYKAIIGQIKIENQKMFDFKIKPMKAGDYKLDFLSRVVIVEKLREVRAFVGFTRVLPPDNKHFNSEETLKESTIVSTKNKNWYPAYEVRGEGIFIEIDFNKLVKWGDIQIVQERVNKISFRNKELLKRRGAKDRNITPEFMMLHTLAHLIIKQLSFNCGYSSASLRERIYFNKNENELKMSGILIYTASGDSEGTLGGLIRQGLADRLPKIIIKALATASWCSNDPVCIESQGQGRDSMNLASCYACSLISETSCEEFNTFLDRGLLIGTIENREIGFLSRYIR